MSHAGRYSSRGARGGALLLAALLGAPAGAPPGAAPQDHDHPAPPVEKLGTVRFDNSCAEAARPDFTRGVALFHSFAFRAAAASFDRALASDPRCAIAWWGIALSAWGNPFAPGLKSEAQLAKGLDAIGRARATGAPTDREKAYIEAAGRLYDDYRTVGQPARLAAWRDAMAAVASKYPEDAEASIFYALALAATADPADKTYASQLKAGAILEKIQPQQPDHPGIAHYIIHAYDVPALAPRALEAARRYASIAPAAPHALHMPSHTFTRLGLWQESIDTNIASASAAEREGSTSEQLHAMDYMMYAYLQTAQDAAARRLLDSLPAIAGRFDPAATGSGAPPMAGWFALAAIPARYALERGDWAGAAALSARECPFPWTEAMTRFARALGAARGGDAAAAKPEVEALARIRDRVASAGEPYWSEQVEIQREGAAAWIALAEGRRDDALAGMRAAADREDATEKAVVTPGPLAPARELLGEMLLQIGSPAAALDEFETTLKHEPDRFRALAGAARSAAAAGRSETAARYWARLTTVCERADRPGRPDLQQAARAAGPAR